MNLTWDNNADMSHWLCFARGNVVQVNGVDYCIVVSDPGGLTVWPSDEHGDPIDDAPSLSIPWPVIEQLHIY